MPRHCSVCQHPDAAKINEEVITGAALRGIARAYRVSEDALFRHRSHVPPEMAKSRHAAEAARADDLVGRLLDLDRETAAILCEARTGKLKRMDKDGAEIQGHDPDIALKALARIEKQIELRAELLGELNRAPTINVSVGVGLQTVIQQALASGATEDQLCRTIECDLAWDKKPIDERIADWKQLGESLEDQRCSLPAST